MLNGDQHNTSQAARRLAMAARKPKSAAHSVTIVAACIAAVIAILAALSVEVAQDPPDWRAFAQSAISAVIVALSAVLGRVRRGGGQPISRRARPRSAGPLAAAGVAVAVFVASGCSGAKMDPRLAGKILRTTHVAVDVLADWCDPDLWQCEPAICEEVEQWARVGGAGLALILPGVIATPQRQYLYVSHVDVVETEGIETGQEPIVLGCLPLLRACGSAPPGLTETCAEVRAGCASDGVRVVAAPGSR